MRCVGPKARSVRKFPLLLSAAAAQVAAQYVTTTFDPYISAPAGSGITRLAFSSPLDGSPIELSNLSAPVQFTLPATPLSLTGESGANGRAVCAFWSEAEGAYRRAANSTRDFTLFTTCVVHV